MMKQPSKSTLWVGHENECVHAALAHASLN
jgi:hypothetical protein